MNILENIPFKKNQAVVFDIDDTLINSKTNQLIDWVFDLYNYCIIKGYNIYIITARPGTVPNMNATIKQLARLNIGNYKRLYFRHPHDMQIARFKKLARKSINKKVVLSIGDQPGDIGEYGGVGVIV